MNKKFLSFMVAMMLMVLMTFNTVADDGAREIVFSGKEAGVLLIGANYDGSYDGDYSFSTVEELT